MRDTSWIWFWLGVFVLGYGLYGLWQGYVMSIISVIFGGLIVYDMNHRLNAWPRIKRFIKRRL